MFHVCGFGFVEDQVICQDDDALMLRMLISFGAGGTKLQIRLYNMIQVVSLSNVQ